MLALGGLDVIDGFAVDERSSDGRGQVLAPWPNRLTDGAYSYGGRECQAPINEPDRQDAIHGLVRWLDWTPIEHVADHVTLTCAVRPQPAYEWQLDLRLTYSLAGNGLTVTCIAVNADAAAAPFGLGFHPYLTLSTAAVDSLHLTIPAATFLDPDTPADTPAMVPVSGTERDFTRARTIGATRLDTAYGDLARGADGRAVARLEDRESSRSVELWVDEGYRYVMAYTGDQVTRVERRRAAVAIEPMTCLPDSFRSGVDLIELAPGASWRGTWGIVARNPR